MNVATSLNMSHYIASDVPLSPISSDWDHHTQFPPTSLDFTSLHYNYSLGSTSSGSPLPVSKMLRGRMSPDTSESEPQLCLPTSQVFDMSYAPSPEVMSSPPSEPDPLPSSPDQDYAVVPSKRASSSSAAATSVSKKPRATISTKDYIPPDVSGLSKREARLVKNRAAAFLSRQRKREEFETMEQRVAELEQENARLLAISQSGRPLQPQPQEKLLSEVEQLRAQLAAAEARERELNEELKEKEAAAAAAAAVSIKLETAEPMLPLAPRAAPSQAIHKSGASLGLMVLLCALPTLLTLPTQSTLPTSFSLPLSGALQAPSSTFDAHSFMSNDYDWMTSSASIMDLDMDETLSSSRATSTGAQKRLEFVDEDSEALGLSGLDISFDATPSEDGKIRVRIHPPASTSVSSAPSPEAHSSADGDDQSMWGGSEFGAPSPSATDVDQLGPFLGVGADFGMSGPHMSVDSNSALASPTFTTHSQESFDFGFGELSNGYSSFGVSTPQGRRRVRIALKSMPGQGSEGGEWEIQLC